MPANPSSSSHIARSIEYSQALMRRHSITPHDDGCQDWIAHRLQQLGFTLYRFKVEGVSNLVASIGQGEHTIAFAGHTDVVPPGDVTKWWYDPFAPTIRNNELIGRGAADMKTGIAAMLAATERLVQVGHTFNQRFMWLITSDEEGEAEHGSKEIKAYLDANDIQISHCIVGEPTAQHKNR